MKLSMLVAGMAAVAMTATACASEAEGEEVASAEGAWIFDGKPRDAEYRMQCHAKCSALQESDDAELTELRAVSPTAFSSGDCLCKLQKDAPRTRGACRFSPAITSACEVFRGRPSTATTPDEEACIAVCRPTID